MKNWPPHVRRRPRHIRVPAFSPVPLRSRADGWTPQRQADFLGALAETRSALAAARRVGMSRESAYRLRRREDAGSFAAAWDAALGRADTARRKVTSQERARRAIEGLLKPHFWKGKHVGTERKADISALLGHVAMLDRAEAKAGAVDRKSQSFGAGFVSIKGCHSGLSQDDDGGLAEAPYRHASRYAWSKPNIRAFSSV
jgi:hypothetical protein